MRDLVIKAEYLSNKYKEYVLHIYVLNNGLRVHCTNSPPPPREKIWVYKNELSLKLNMHGSQDKNTKITKLEGEGGINYVEISQSK